MKNIILTIICLVVSASVVRSADTKSPRVIKDMESLEGITHYGMPIEEISKLYRKDASVLTIVYSKTLSDDNMDNYVKRFYDELLRQVEKWLYENKLPSKDLRLVISNCKFCKIGYCKKKNIKEIDLVLYSNGKNIKHLALKHEDLIDKNKYVDIARSAVIIFLDKPQ
ncbi:MAG TPA: hypothetical protein PKN50_03855 [Spirochaetota bacterium]|nr:hypothetical protein [Spirochaetota bacterium]HPV41722.1 hypothetical protein [Spirochaetota bacterium]